MSTKDDILEPFDFKKSPSMSSQLFKAAPGVFGDGDGLSFLQGANRVLVGGPLDVIDAVGRAGETGLRAVAEGVEAATGLTGIKRDIYGLGQAAGLVVGASPSALPSLKSPSTSTRSGAEKAFKSPPKQDEISKILPHDDLDTSELLTSYIISPTRNPESKSGVTRQELVNRLSSDANAQIKTQKALDELGYKDTVPVFRTVILKDGKAMDPETITSVSLRPKAFADTNSFLTQGKIGFGDNVIAVRYDVPRDKFIGYFPALADDIKSSVNKKIKEKGIGQTEIEGFKTVTNPSEHAKNLIEMQDEAIVDVSGLTAKPLKVFDKDEIQSMISMNSFLPRKVASQELKSGPEVRAALGESYTAVNPFKFKGTKEEFEQLNQEAAQKMFDNYERFFRGNYKQGGIVYNPFNAGIGAL